MKNEKMKVAVFSLVLLALSLAVLFGTQWRGSTADTAYAVRHYLYIFPAVAVLATVGHIVDSRKLSVKEYVKSVFTGTKKVSDRTLYLDYARCLAAACVILTHACSSQRLEAAAPWKTAVLSIVTAVTLVCNPLYVMLSGALLLSSKKEETLLSFYRNRFVKVVLPFMVYYFVLLCAGGTVDITSFSSIGEGFKQMLAGASGVAPHYWIMYVFFSLYLVAPFLKKMLQALSDRQIKELTVLIVLSLIFEKYAGYIGLSLGVTFEFASWIGVFLLGYIVAEKSDVISPLWFIIPGAVFFVLLAIVAATNYDYAGLFFNTAPPMVFCSAGLMSLLKLCEPFFKKKKNTLALVLSKYSFSILLIHWYGLFVVTMGFLPIQPLRFGCIGGILLTLVVALIMCFILGFFMDNTLVTAVRAIGYIPKLFKHRKE